MTFDDTILDTDETSGIVVSNLNIPLNSAPAFRYHQPGDILYIGGSAAGVFGFLPGADDDFFMAIGNATTASPNLYVFLYRSSDFPDFTFGSVGPKVLTPTEPVPEPASITLLGLGLAGMGVRRWRQRKA